MYEIFFYTILVFIYMIIMWLACKKSIDKITEFYNQRLDESIQQFNYRSDCLSKVYTKHSLIMFKKLEEVKGTMALEITKINERLSVLEKKIEENNEFR